MNDPQFEQYADAVRRELIPKLRGSGCVISIVPAIADDLDVKFAVELGLSVMLDKPIIALVRPGTKIPDKLARVVDRFVEFTLGDPTSEARLKDALSEITQLRGG